MIRCKQCGYWKKDGNGGWGVCLNEVTALNVEHWKRQQTRTFEIFGCVFGNGYQNREKVRKEKADEKERSRRKV
jgi:hypothetical protein